MRYFAFRARFVNYIYETQFIGAKIHSMQKPSTTMVHSPMKKKQKLSNGISIKPLKFAVDGNIAAGKSTLVDALKERRPEWSIFPEPVTRWTSVSSNTETLTASQQNGGNLLQSFYDDKSRWAFTFQYYALFSKLRLHSKSVDSVNSPSPVQIYERSYYSDRYIFAENCFNSGHMDTTEWGIYKDFCDYWVNSMGSYDLEGLIYLQASPETCIGRRMIRGRPEEKSIPKSYIETLHEKHEDLFYHKSTNVGESFKRLPILVVDCDSNCPDKWEENVKKVIDFIEKSSISKKSSAKSQLAFTNDSESSGCSSETEL